MGEHQRMSLWRRKLLTWLVRRIAEPGWAWVPDRLADTWQKIADRREDATALGMASLYLAGQVSRRGRKAVISLEDVVDGEDERGSWRVTIERMDTPDDGTRGER